MTNTPVGAVSVTAGVVEVPPVLALLSPGWLLEVFGDGAEEPVLLPALFVVCVDGAVAVPSPLVFWLALTATIFLW